MEHGRLVLRRRNLQRRAGLVWRKVREQVRRPGQAQGGACKQAGRQAS